MTDRRRASTRQPGPAAVVSAALGSFLVLLTVLAFQMRSGGDPVLKPTVAAQQPKTILKRRIIKTRIIIFDAPKTNPGAPLRQASAAVVARPTVTASAPIAPVSPAPVAPAPAPVTRTS
jgi:hypothetical protein